MPVFEQPIRAQGSSHVLGVMWGRMAKKLNNIRYVKEQIANICLGETYKYQSPECVVREDNCSY